MTTVEIRHEIVQRLFSVEDKNLLQKILELLPVAQSKSDDWWDDLSKEEQEFLEKSAAEAERGEVVPHEVVIAEVRALLQKERN